MSAATTTSVEVFATPTEYTVSCIPESNINRGHFEITVSYRGDGRWAVTRHRWCLSADGEWEFEMRPSEREDEWLATHRFDLDTALALARREAPKVKVNGFAVADILAQGDAR